MLILLVLFPMLWALVPEPASTPHPVNSIYSFATLYQNCSLNRFLPLSAATAHLRVLSVKPENWNDFSISYFTLDCRDLSTLKQVDYKYSFDFCETFVFEVTFPKKLVFSYRDEARQQLHSAQGIWSHDNLTHGHFEKSEDFYSFSWNNQPRTLIFLKGLVGITYSGFATKDYVYTQVSPEYGVHKFARWKADLSGEIEILGDSSPEDRVLIFQYPFGPIYYLTDKKCLQIDDIKQLSEGYKSFRECDTNEGMFVYSDLFEWYSLSAFAWVTRECNDEMWTNYWAHAFVKVQFLPDDPPAIRRTTTTTTRSTRTTTATTATNTTRTTTKTIESTTTSQTTRLPIEVTPCEDFTDPPEHVCRILTPSFYAIAISTLAAFSISTGIACGIFCFFMGRKYQQKKQRELPQVTLSNRKETTGPGGSTYSTTIADPSTNISRMESMASISSTGLPADAVTKLLLSPEIEKVFDQNEVEGVEAELAKAPLKRPAEPQDGFFFTFGKIGVTIPAKTFNKAFGEFEMEMGGEVCTVQYEDVKCELNRVEAMAAVMRQAKKCQKNGTIPEFILLVQLDNLHFRLLVTKKLGPSIEKQVLSGTLSTEEKLKLVLMTFNCMEDLLFCNIIHRDIKPSSFHYDFVGSKIVISNLGLARITPTSPRLKLPFFGSVIFCSPSTHLKLERTHFDDMISYFYVVLWIFNKDLLIWSGETDKTVVYQLKSDLMEGRVLEERLEKFIHDKKIRDFLVQLFRLILKLPPKRPSYRQIRQLIEKNNDNIKKTNV